MSAPSADCVLCREAGGLPVWQGAQLRVIRAQEEGFPAFYRVVWQSHVAEFSDLPAGERQLCMAAVVAVERALRDALAPRKINLAALGNMVPHLHWHVIARFAWDSHFPSPVWAQPVRERDPAREDSVAALHGRMDNAIRARLEGTV